MSPKNGNGRTPRQTRNTSAAAWHRALALVTEVYGSSRTWNYIAQQTTDDPALYSCLCRVGCKAVAERDRFTATNLEAEFRDLYERETVLAQDQYSAG
jgi:hypothetical protein